MTERSPTYISTWRKVLYSGVAILLAILLVEGALRILYGAVELREAYQWWVGTHLVDISYADFVQRQERIRTVRAQQQMERGATHHILGWTYNPTFHIDEADAQIHINSLGLRGEEVASQKPPGEIRIICLGGSTTAGEEVAEAQTYPAQLQTLLHQRFPDRSIRVINAGIPSYDVPRSFLQYALLDYRLDPDFVTIYHGINDLLYHRNGGPWVTPKHNYSGRLLEPFVYQGDADDAFWLAELRPLAHKSYVMKLAHDALAPWMYAGEQLTAPDQRGIDEFVVYYRALLRQIVANGAVPIPMTFALAYPGQFEDADRKKIERSFQVWLSQTHISNEVGRQIIDRQNQMVVDLSRDERLPLADVATAVPANRQHFIDVCHLTAEGNRRTAETLAATLSPLIDAIGTPPNRAVASRSDE